MRKLSASVRFGLAFLAVLLSGCAHQVSFQDAQYTVEGSKQAGGIVAVIDQNTLDKTVAIRSLMAGIANSWEAKPGDMLKQVADIELPQTFERYEFATSASQADLTGFPTLLELTIPQYRFEDFKATITVRAIARTASGAALFDNSYTKEGDTQGGKMFVGGAFGMKSAIRQSSLDAYKKIFAAIRDDLSVVVTMVDLGSVERAAVVIPLTEATPRG